MSPRHVIFVTVALAFSLAALAQQKQLPIYADSAAATHAGEEAIVTGKVVAVSKSAKGTTYLNFGERFPRQVFSGVVLVRDQEKVGDMKIYEGKEVALTGKIELSQDQKPQIVITVPQQIKLAGAAEAPVPPPTTPAPVPPPPVATPPPPVAVLATPAPKITTAPARKIALASNWNSPTQGGEMTRKDLALLLGTLGKSGEEIEGDPSLVVWNEITFLMPRADWRRDNINRFVEALYRGVKRVRPAAKVGISPFGIWRPRVPETIDAQLDAYAQLFADSRHWLRERWCDYFTPQLYWDIDRPAQSFPVLLEWWRAQAPRGIPVWPGLAADRIGAARPANEIIRQIELTRRGTDAPGHVLWDMKALMLDKGGIVGRLKSGPYAR